MLIKNNIPSGKDIPNDIYVIIEIPLNTCYVKYEKNKKYNSIWVDRFIKIPIFYPFNYGYINNTLSKDKDSLDVLVICKYPLYINSIIQCRPIGVLKLIDECGEDNKILAIPNYNITDEYNSIQDICDISKDILNNIWYFFEHYKDLDKNKWIKIDNWYDIHEAKNIIINSINLYKKSILK